MRTDVHTHTTFSDGSNLDAMITAAEDAGIEGLGLTDHCILTDDDFGRAEQYDLDETYERRRAKIDAARADTDVRLYDAVELSFVADDADRIRDFLATADFAYAIGSVHFAGDYDYTSDAPYVDATDEVRRDAVERYYDAVVDLIEADLFEVLGHLDLPERCETLRGHSRQRDYERVSEALASASTVPEINAGRIHDSLGRPHPDPELLSQFTDDGVEFVLGTDSHRPGEIRERVPALETVVERSGVEPLRVESLS